MCIPASTQEQDPLGEPSQGMRAVLLVDRGILSTCGDKIQGLEPVTWKGNFMLAIFTLIEVEI